MGNDDALEPETPREAGVPTAEPSTEDEEPARLVENEVRPRLAAEGFSDEQILRWVEAYFAEHTEGTADDVIAWVRRQQASSP